MKFTATVVLGGKTATGIPVPPEVVDELGQGKKRVAVRATVAGHGYRTTIAPMGDAFFIPLSAENREAAGVAAGDEVEVELERDDAPREVDVPAALADALDADPAVRASFDALSYSNKRRIVISVEEAKTEATRTRRILKAIEGLQPPMSSSE